MKNLLVKVLLSVRAAESAPFNRGIYIYTSSIYLMSRINKWCLFTSQKLLAK